MHSASPRARNPGERHALTPRLPLSAVARLSRSPVCCVCPLLEVVGDAAKQRTKTRIRHFAAPNIGDPESIIIQPRTSPPPRNDNGFLRLGKTSGRRCPFIGAAKPIQLQPFAMKPSAIGTRLGRSCATTTERLCGDAVLSRAAAPQSGLVLISPGAVSPT